MLLFHCGCVERCGRFWFIDMDIATVHYNTPELTGALVRSVRKWTPDARITIFDNSDRRPFPPTEGVTVIDNTRGQIIDFDTFIQRWPMRESNERSNFGSVKHTMSVDYLFDVLTDGFVLLDSDVLVKRDLTEIADPSVSWCGQLGHGLVFAYGRFRPRALPFVCWINVPMCREHGIRYFDETRTWKLERGKFYDTGASFYLDCRRADLPERQIKWEDYAVHFKGGSWDDRDPLRWLEENRALYD